MEVILKKLGKTILKDEQETVREIIESMVEERLGLYLELQENTEDGEFQIYLHTDNYEHLSSNDIRKLEAMNITDDPVLTTEGIKRLLNVDFRVVEHKIA